LCAVVGCGFLLLPSLLLADAQSDFDMLFGEEAKRVSATADKADDVRLAAKFLDAAAEMPDAPELQVLLNRKAYEFAMKGDGGIRHALEAAEFLEQADPDNAAKWKDRKDRLQTLLPEAPRATGAPPPLRLPEADWPDPAIQKIRSAVEGGVKYLWSRQKHDGSWDTYYRGSLVCTAGPTALVCYALLECGVSPHAERMQQALEWLAQDKSDKTTYTLALRCQVWLMVNPKLGNKYQDLFRRDLALLIKSTKDGGYSYQADGTPRTRDNSNAQFGVLGVWAGARANMPIPGEYWSKVLEYWLRGQQQGGGWAYMPAKTNVRDTMTAAGLASLFVCVDYHPAIRHGRGGRTADLADEGIRKGMQWFERNFAGTVLGVANTYYLFSVERIGFACGYKYFGATDWFQLGTKQLLACQEPDGSFYAQYAGDPRKRNKVISTAFALLFLGRGLDPVLFGRLVRDDRPPARPWDLVGLTRWLFLTFERPFYWQLVNVKTPVTEWHDAPILFLTGHNDPKFSTQELSKLRAFVLQGGTIFSAPSGSEPFCRGMRETYKKLFPKYDLRKLEADHELYLRHFDLKGKPVFHMVDNGIRPLAIHTDSHLPLRLPAVRRASQEWGFRAIANVYQYMVGSGVLRPRGVNHWPKAERKVQRTIRLAQLACPGYPRPEPLACHRFSNMLVNETGLKVQPLDSVPVVILNRTGAKIALLTGTRSLKLNDVESKVLKDWIVGGGTLVVDAAGSLGLTANAEDAKAFAADVRKHLVRMFGEDSMARTTALHDLDGHEISKVRFRNRPKRLQDAKECPLDVCMVAGRPAVVLCRDNLTAGLVGYMSGVVRGYSPESAYQIMRNIVLHAAGSSSTGK